MTTTTTAPSRTSPADNAEVVVRCSSVTKIFRDFWMRPRARAVDSIDLDIRRGEVFGLLGPNGSGKSTTIKMILGLLAPTSGRIGVFGKPPDDVSTKKLIGYLPEESYLYRFLTARETLDYYARLFHLNRDQRKRRVDMLLEMVGLDTAQQRPVGEYSKGMQRRIGLAQALINDPQFVILDEPTTGLDPLGSRLIKDIIVTLAKRGKTILLCSHLLADVEDVCDRVSIMYGGKMRAHGTVESLLTRHDATTIQTEPLDEETMRQVRQVLAARGKKITSIEQPRQKLEALFLDIVQRAQAEGVSTSGARSGGRMAEFLVTSESDEPQAILQQLIQPQPAATTSPAAPPPVTPPAGPKPDNQVLESLSVKAPATAPAPAIESPKPDLSVIDNLITTEPPVAQQPVVVEPSIAPPEPITPPTTKIAPAPALPPTPPQPPAPPQPTSTNRTSTSGEKPDEGFLKALQNVPPFKGDDNSSPKRK